jgi:hypothetical protein
MHIKFLQVITAFAISFATIFNAGNLKAVPVPVNVKDFGALGDGKADDTEAVISAVKNCTDGIVEFPRGTYRLTRTIDIFLPETGTTGIAGIGGSARIIMEGKGPAFRFTGTHKGSADPESVTPTTYEMERMPLVDAIEIIGANPKSDGIEFRHTIMPVIRSVLIREVRHGIHLFSRNRNVIIDGCHIYNCTGIGIFLDSVNLHQIIISDSHISYCNMGGIRIMRSEVRDIQITGNDIEYNYDAKGPVSADIWFDCSERGSIREGVITGNTIQAIPSSKGSNIRFTGPAANNEQVGLISISGNHISNQTFNIILENARGVSIGGNNFIRGYDQNISVSNCRDIVISSNIFDRNRDYYTPKIVCNDGISITGSRSVIISDNILDGFEYGSPASGGALNINESSEITVSGCHILSPKFRGIAIGQSKNVLITDCVIREDGIKRMTAAIELRGQCQGTRIKDNILGKGSGQDIINNAKGIAVEGNTPAAD